MLIRQGDVVQWPKEPEGYEDDYRAQWPTLLAGPPDPDYDTVDPEYDEPLEDFDNDVCSPVHPEAGLRSPPGAHWALQPKGPRHADTGQTQGRLSGGWRNFGVSAV